MRCQINLSLPGLCCYLALFLMCSALSAKGQSIVTKLNELVTFETASTTTEGQLIDFARTFQIPMGMELVVSGDDNSKHGVHISNEPAINALKQIVESDGTLAFDVRDEVVHIYSRKYVDDLRNFLNIRLASYELKNESLTAAKHYLNLEIRRQLKPNLNYGGGYGGVGLNDDFDVKSITLAAKNQTVREILDRLIAIQANALWVVRLKPNQTRSASPYYSLATSANGDGTSEDFFWQFLPLHGVRSN